MSRLRDTLAALRDRRRARRARAFERYYLRRELRAHRAELSQWDADCANLKRLPTPEVPR